jgi:nucleotidyltransferase/DNA polymerase involved in DNA repair
MSATMCASFSPRKVSRSDRWCELAECLRTSDVVAGSRPARRYGDREQLAGGAHHDVSIRIAISLSSSADSWASDHRKPDGLFVITPKMGPAFVEGLPVGKFHGVGPATTAKMNRLGIHTGLDLRDISSNAVRPSITPRTEWLRVICWKSAYLIFSVTVRPRVPVLSQ